MSVPPSAPRYIHATAVAIDGHGILISGVSKAGKSTLAEALIAEARANGHLAEFIGDDRIGLLAHAGAIEIAPHPSIAGLIERRGRGIESISYRPSARARLEIRLDGGADEIRLAGSVERLPGLRLSRIVAPQRPAATLLLPLVLAALPQ